MSGKTIHYFASGNTALGRYSLYHSVLADVTSLFVITGSPGTGKSTILQNIAAEAQQLGFDVEQYLSPNDPHTLDALIIPQAKLAIVDGHQCQEEVSKRRSQVVLHIDLDQALQENILTSVSDQLSTYKQWEEDAYQNAYAEFSRALRIHDDWEQIYITRMDYDKADELATELIATYLPKQPQKESANVRHLFLGAATPDGAIDFIPQITAEMNRRIYIKGRAGTGKSTIMKKLLATAAERKLDVDVFHCGFDPNSLDMVLFPELKVAIFDSTAPHEHFPVREGDVIVDTYERTIASGTDEAFAERIAELQATYRQAMKQAINSLNIAKSWRDKQKQLYGQATNYYKVEELYKQLRDKLKEKLNSSAV